MDVATETRIPEDLEALTWDDLDERGRLLTERIREADDLHDQALVDELLRAKDHVNRMKGRL